MVYRTKKSGYKNKRNNKTRKLNNKRLKTRKLKALKGGSNELTHEELQAIGKGWKYLEGKTTKIVYDFTTSLLPVNQQKNRYANILAQESTLVRLIGDDTYVNLNYINANYIYRQQKEGGPTTSFDMFNKLIATQGPKPDTISDFWQMLEQEKIGIVVMLCNLLEKKKIYSRKMINGILTVVVKEVIVNKCGNYYTKNITPNEQSLNGTIKRILFNPKSTGKNNHEYTTKQYHFEDWPDNGVPIGTAKDNLYALVEHIMDLPKRKTQKVVVHCSAGVGRTGTFIIMCYLYQHYMINKERKQLTIDNLVDLILELRKLRNRLMVQTDVQFQFICEYNDYLNKKKQNQVTEGVYGIVASQQRSKPSILPNQSTFGELAREGALIRSGSRRVSGSRSTRRSSNRSGSRRQQPPLSPKMKTQKTGKIRKFLGKIKKGFTRKRGQTSITP